MKSPILTHASHPAVPVSGAHFSALLPTAACPPAPLEGALSRPARPGALSAPLESAPCLAPQAVAAPPPAGPPDLVAASAAPDDSGADQLRILAGWFVDAHFKAGLPGADDPAVREFWLDSVCLNPVGARAAMASALSASAARLSALAAPRSGGALDFHREHSLLASRPARLRPATFRP